MTACDCRPDPLVFGHHCPASPAADPGTLVRVIACTPDCRRQHEQPPGPRPHRYAYAGRRRSVAHLGGYVPPVPGGTP